MVFILFKLRMTNFSKYFSFQILPARMGQKQSKGRISQEDLTYLMKNTNHSKKEIKVSLVLLTDNPCMINIFCRNGTKGSWRTAQMES